MFPIQITPESAVKELSAFNQKLSKGFETLSQIADVTPGVTEKEVVYEEDKLKLMHFKAKVPNPHGVPVLIIYALVNRPYMADLQDDRSTIKGLLENGLDVYLIDWGYPDPGDRYLELQDYIDGYIKNCVDHIRRAHNLDKINILGICMGGTISACFCSFYPELVKNLVLMVTPIDFHSCDDRLHEWVEGVDVDLMVDTLGNLPGSVLNQTFQAMSPMALGLKKYVDMVYLMDDKKALENFLRMEYWINDSPDQPGETLRQYVRDMYQRNALVAGNVTIGGRKVDLANLTMPILNVYATLDHLVPPDGSKILGKLCKSSDYNEMSFKGGHIGIYVSGRAQKEVPAGIAQWVKER
ncbi:MAG: class III poly(R)-hydroxyalkanoic acid synthase subunit PhaC [Magnetococcales bacterium]|nr:class III poly(R)-hydroxyalkanoic acid synthase subunit PhaC [Magnetococcales bacterium]